MPTEPVNNDRSLALRQVDFNTADPQSTIGDEAQPIADSVSTINSDAESEGDSVVTGDAIPQTCIGSVITERIVASTVQISGDGIIAHADPHATIADEPHAIADSETPQDTIPQTGSGSVSIDTIVPSTARDSANEGGIDPNRTVSNLAVDPRQTVSAIFSSNGSQHLSRTDAGTGGPSIPGYEILGTLGRGGMGVVYKAKQTGLNRLVALKMNIGGSHVGAKQLARFGIEAKAVAQLRHPNIVQIYDIGEVDGMPFVSLELVEGGDLQNRLAGTPQPGGPAALLLATLARAVHAAHQARIVHRDLKPPNVLLTADGVPKITDFGLAKRLESDDNQTRSGDIMGTPSYMAPEQALGHNKDVGPAADIYALGAILYEVLTGRPPLKGETVMETVRLVIHEDPVAPSRLVPRLARDLETICMKCLNKDQHKRYESADALAADLDRYREGKPIEARPTPLWERGLKWSKRRPAAAMSLAIGLLAFIGLTAGIIAFQRYNLLQKERRNSWVLQQQNRGIELLELADRAEKSNTPDDLQKAKFDLATFLLDAKAEPRLEPIRLRTEAKVKEVDDRLLDLSSRQAAQERERVDRERFRKFLDLRQEAQLYAASFGMLVETDRIERVRASAHAALATYAHDPQASDDAWALAAPLPAALTGSEKARVADDCYDLLLIRSQAAEPVEGLRILDRAVWLRPQSTAAYHLRRADCLERAGDLAGRDRENRQASLIKPETALDFFLNGRALASRRQFAAAIRLLDTAVQRDLDQTSAHLLLAVCYLNVQPRQLSAAATSLTACMRSHPDLAGLYLLRASIFGEEGMQAQGKEAADALDAALTDYGHSLALRPDDEALRYGVLASRGLLRLRSRQLDLAVADLEAAIRLKPNQYQAHTTLGQVFQSQGRLDLAAASFARAIACQPAPSVQAGLYRTRALIYASRDDITPSQRESALKDLAEAIEREPDVAMKASDQVWRARLLFGGGKSPEALAACDAALALEPDEPQAHRVRISALMALRRYDEVLASADAYIARGKPSAEIFEIRGLSRENRRNYPGAISDFNAALEHTTDAQPHQRTRLLNLRGWAYLFADAPKLALPDFEESLLVDPNQFDALGGRGLSRIMLASSRLGEWRPAVTDAEAAVRLATAVVPRTGKDRQARTQALFNAARVYALALDFAFQDLSRQGERGLVLYRKYRSRALDLQDEALKDAPDPDYRDTILSDPALRSLRRGTNRGAGQRLSSLFQDPNIR